MNDHQVKLEGGLRTRGIKKKSYPGKPLISIITVTYNRNTCLEKAILSVLNQSYDNLEYIIIDGGSTDDSVNLIKKYENMIDYWVSEPDTGMYYALNKGIDIAAGDLIGICHSDDHYYDNNVISTLVSVYATAAADIYHGDMIPLSLENKSLKVVSRAELILKTHNSIVHPSTFIRKEVFEKFGNYNTCYRSASDYEMMLKLKINKCSFYHLGIIVCVMNDINIDRVSNNCYSHLETYRIHKRFMTGNHFKYLRSFLKCTFKNLLKSIYTSIKN